MLAFSHSVRSILLAVVYSIGTFSKIGLIKYILVGNVQKRKKETKPYLFPHFSNVFHLCSLFKLFLDAFSLKLVRKYHVYIVKSVIEFIFASRKRPKHTENLHGARMI